VQVLAVLLMTLMSWATGTEMRAASTRRPSVRRIVVS